MNMKMIVDSIGNFDFNVLLAGFNDSSHVLTQVELISLIVLGVLGIGICLTGWKFVRVWAVIFGFVSGTVGGAAAAYFGTGSGSNSDRIKYMEEKSGRFLVMLADDSTGGSPSSETGQCDSVGSLYRCRSACSSSLYLVFKHCYDFCHFHFWRYGYRKLYLLSDSCKYEMDPYCIMHSGSGTRSVDSDAHGIG